MTPRLQHAAVLLLILAFFLSFAWQAAHARFSADEMMNIHWYWEAGVAKILRANVAPWMPPIRPMAAIYYWPLFKIFGLNPVPFDITRIALVFAMTCAFYTVAFRISRSIVAAGLASMVIAYHGSVGEVVYIGSFIYDVLCALFFFAALAYYLGCRELRPTLTLTQDVVFLLLYICALNSKEMAVSLPVILFAYECLNRAPVSWQRFGPVLAAIGITIVFVLAKTHGSEALVNNDAYALTFTWDRFSRSSIRFMNTMFYTRGFTMPYILAAWSVVLAGAIVAKNTAWKLLWVWIMVTPLPLAFIPDRDRGCLPIVLAGWAMLLGMLSNSVITRISRRLHLTGWPRWLLATAFVAVLVAGYVRQTRTQHRFWMTTYLKDGEETRAMIDQLQTLKIRPKPASSVVFMHDPFEGFDTLFIARLVWDDPSIVVFLQNHAKLSPQEIASVDYEFDFADWKLVLRRAPAGDTLH